MRRTLHRAAPVLALAIGLLGARPATAAKFAGEFMAVGPGARALAMGGAFVALADDASAIYWNPAGLAGRSGRQALAMHAERFGGLVAYDFAGWTQPGPALLGSRGAWGVGLLHLGVDDIVVTRQLGFVDLNGNGRPDGNEQLVDADGNPVTDFSTLPRESDHSFALFGSFGALTRHASVGGSIKLIYSNAIAGESAVGIGIDLGLLRRDLFVRGLDVGLKLRDATGTYISWSTGTNEFIRPMARVGGAYTLPSRRFNGTIRLALDAEVFFDDRRAASQFWVRGVSTDLHVGTELALQDRVFVRGGLDAGRPTAGAGFRVAFLGFDYAYLHHDDFEATHRVSVLANF